MTTLFIFQVILTLLACVGFTNIVVNGTILNAPRRWFSKVSFFKELLKCSMCSGWHVGLWYGCICLLLASHWCFWLLTMPFASSIISLLGERIFVHVDNQIIKDEMLLSEMEENEE